MNVLSKEAVSYIRRSIDTAAMMGIETIIIDDHSLRGENKEEGLIIIKPREDSDSLDGADFTAVAIDRVSTLRKRLRVFDGDDVQIGVETKVRDNKDTYVSEICIFKNRTKVTFRCIFPSRVRAPKSHKGTNLVTCKLTPDTIKMMKSGRSAMGTDDINFSVSDDGFLKLTISDGHGDAMSHVETVQKVEFMEDAAEDALDRNYKLRRLLTIFSDDYENKTTIDLSITDRGILCLSVSGIMCYILPEKKMKVIEI